MTLAFHGAELLSSLSKARLSPGPLVPEGFKPLTELKISFVGKDVKLGNYLKTGETKEVPTVAFAIAVSSPNLDQSQNRIHVINASNRASHNHYVPMLRILQTGRTRG